MRDHDHDLEPGQILNATTDDPTTGIDFELAEEGRFSGSVIEATTGAFVGSGLVRIFDATGAFLGSAALSDGLYVTTLLPTGTTYFAIADTTFSPELYSEIPCPALACIPTTGDPISLSPGTTTPNIDFTVELATLGGIAGTLRDASTNGPLAEQAFVDVFDSAGSYVDSALVTGSFAIGDLVPGTYFLSTDTSVNAISYLDELYDDLPCHPGGALGSACDPLTGTPIVVTSGVVTGGLVIELMPEQIFVDGFEYGDVSAWAP